MQVRLEKCAPELGQNRVYVLLLTRTLFGEWCLVREWGRIGARGGQRRTDIQSSAREALCALQALKSRKCKRGYVER